MNTRVLNVQEGNQSTTFLGRWELLFVTCAHDPWDCAMRYSSKYIIAANIGIHWTCTGGYIQWELPPSANTIVIGNNPDSTGKAIFLIERDILEKKRCGTYYRSNIDMSCPSSMLILGRIWDGANTECATLNCWRRYLIPEQLQLCLTYILISWSLALDTDPLHDTAQVSPMLSAEVLQLLHFPDHLRWDSNVAR